MCKDGDYLSEDMTESILEDIEAATTVEELKSLRDEVLSYKDSDSDSGGGKSYVKRR